MGDVIQLPPPMLNPSLDEAGIRICYIHRREPNVVLAVWFSNERQADGAAVLYHQIAASEDVVRVEAAFMRSDGSWEPWEP